jgi:pyruvate/2-oxoglutarate dehydrogenase complex dihydrolipoamide dehydrogenase (E3) component/uncharacterized membrane protein YdjX (TVP38/TMEM64 family)
MKTTRLTLIALIAALIAAFFFFDLDRFASLEALKTSVDSLRSWIASHFWLAWISFISLYIVVAALSLPGAAILTLAAGALFGLLWGSIAASIGSTIGATLAFLAARFLLREWFVNKFGSKLASFEQGVRKEGWLYLLALRLVPAVPFVVVNSVMGLTAIRTATFAGVSMPAMLPGTVAYVYAGTQLSQLTSLKGIVSPGLLLAFTILGILPFVLKRTLDFFKSRKVYANYQKPKQFDYNLVVIGAGAAGLVSSYIAAAVKAKVLLIERHKMGGDCLNTGCVPSKALIRAARLMADVANASKFGLTDTTIQFDFAKVMERVQSVIALVEPHDSVERYTSLGVDCLHGSATLRSPWEVEVDGKRISARSIIIATGARPLVPKLPGIDEVAYLTSDTLWNLRELPKRLLVLGGGPIGCELAQAFARFGSKVTIVEMANKLLPREDSDVSDELRTVFEREQITLALGLKAVRLERSGNGGALIASNEQGEQRFEFDQIIMALGRKANTEGFGLQELGITLSERGTIAADELLRTNYPNISVCGDITGPYQFTHVAAHQAWYAAVNQLLAPFWSFKADYRVIPWATFTEPQVARVGLSESEAKAQNIAYEITHYGIDDLDRAIADGAAHGFVKVLTKPGKDEILGATIVAHEAGELIAEYVLAMKHNLGMNRILGTIHAYPTLMEANKYAAGNWKRAHAPQGVLKWAQRFFAWRRR